MNGAISAMRERVKLQRPTRIADEIGGAAIAWIDAGDVWAEIEAGAASENAAFDAAPSEATYRVSINRRDDVRAGWRVAWGPRRLRIVGIADDGAPRVELACREETL